MPTEKIYKLNGHLLLVEFDNQLIRIKKPRALKKFLSEDIEYRSEVLANYIKQDYFLIFNRELEITNDSLKVEIWGHVYASYFATGIKNLIKLKLVENAADFIINRSETIDCGENEVDSNRKFWDVLANLKGMIITFLPKKIRE